MEPILLLVNSRPSSPNATRVFESALTMQAQGHRVSLFLLQDGVLTGLKGEGNKASMLITHTQSVGIAVYALAEDLALRGFTPANLHAGICLADYAQLVDLFGTHARVVGAL